MFEPGIWYSVIKLNDFYERFLFCDGRSGIIFVGMMVEKRDGEGKIYSSYVDLRFQEEHFPRPTHFALLPRPAKRGIPKHYFDYGIQKKPTPIPMPSDGELIKKKSYSFIDVELEYANGFNYSNLLAEEIEELKKKILDGIYNGEPPGKGLPNYVRGWSIKLEGSPEGGKK